MKSILYPLLFSLFGLSSLWAQQSIEGTVTSYKDGLLMVTPHNTSKLPAKGSVCTISKDLTGRNVFGVKLDSGWLNVAEAGYLGVQNKELHFRITRETSENKEEKKENSFSKGQKIKIMW